jgi:hypothetical protein
MISTSCDAYNIPNKNGAWCWFQDPRAVYANNKTFISYIDKVGNVKIANYNHANNTVSEFTLKAGFQVDDHNCPTILIRSDGKLITFWTKHTIEQYIYYRISTNPYDISAWGPEQTIDTGALHVTYSQPTLLSSEDKIYVLFRGHVAPYVDCHWYYITATDDTDYPQISEWIGAVSPVQFIDFLTDGYSSPYLKSDSNNRNRIDINISVHPAHNAANICDIWYCYYKDGSFYKADNTKIEDVGDLPMKPAQLDLVYDASISGKPAWSWHTVSINNKPYLAFVKFMTTADHRYMYAAYSGGWNISEITNGGTFINGGTEVYYSGGVSLDFCIPGIAFVSKQDPSQWEIERWELTSGTWSKTHDLTSSSVHGNYRPVTVRGRNRGYDNLTVVWMYGSYNYYTNYDTTLLSAHCYERSGPPFPAQLFGVVNG